MGFPAYRMTRGRQQFALHDGDNLLGRDPAACVCIDHPSVSRRHARVSIEGNRALLEDLHSRNGTYLNGRRLNVPAEIGDGAVVGLGPITLTFLVLTRPASTQPMSASGPSPFRRREP
jgi:pSer/pThr/pTyr-binding forkhead associated (FHA) protein